MRATLVYEAVSNSPETAACGVSISCSDSEARALLDEIFGMDLRMDGPLWDLRALLRENLWVDNEGMR